MNTMSEVNSKKYEHQLLCSHINVKTWKVKPINLDFTHLTIELVQIKMNEKFIFLLFYIVLFKNTIFTCIETLLKDPPMTPAMASGLSSCKA